MDKHHRSTYPACDSIPSSPAIDLIHCDIWGPSWIRSPLCHLYYIVFFLIIILESSRYIWSKTIHNFLTLSTSLYRKSCDEMRGRCNVSIAQERQNKKLVRGEEVWQRGKHDREGIYVQRKISIWREREREREREEGGRLYEEEDTSHSKPVYPRRRGRKGRKEERGERDFCVSRLSPSATWRRALDDP